MAPLDPEPGNNTTDISDKGRFVEPSADEILLWAVVCALVTFFGLGLATFKYLRDQYDTPDNKKKRKDKSELERRVHNVSSATDIREEKNRCDEIPFPERRV
uniref:Uncharacterized protein n=1 Tax=Magallana gigas TaxID=29159 RepID=A0A8W8NJ90_MAGGI